MDLATVSKLYTLDGPFVSIYLDTTSNVADAARRLDLRWDNVQRELAERGVDDATRQALSRARGDHDAGNTRVLIAAGGRVQLATWLPEPPVADIVRVAALPHLLPLIDALQLRVPHVVVLTDRQGADVFAYTTGPDAVEEFATHSTAWPVHRSGVGGWASKRYDATVENNWESSAKDVAELVDGVARDVDAQLVTGCGDVRAVSLLRDQLPTALAERFTIVEGGGRAADGSDELVAERVLQAVADRVARDALDLLDRFAQERGQHDRACAGVTDTLVALRRAQVDTLLLTDAFADERDVWFGPEATQLALDRQELLDLGVADPQRAPLVDVLLRAALGTGARVRLVGGGVQSAPKEGLGALLRFALPA